MNLIERCFKKNIKEYFCICNIFINSWLIAHFSFPWDGYECCKGSRASITIRHYVPRSFKLEHGGGGGYFVKSAKVTNISIQNVMFKGFNLRCLFMSCSSKHTTWINVNRIRQQTAQCWQTAMELVMAPIMDFCKRTPVMLGHVGESCSPLQMMINWSRTRR